MNNSVIICLSLLWTFRIWNMNYDCSPKSNGVLLFLQWMTVLESSEWRQEGEELNWNILQNLHKIDPCCGRSCHDKSKFIYEK